MNSLTTTTAPRPAILDTRATATPAAIYGGALWTLLAAKMIAGWGVQWDIQWHVVIGRDSFWIAPHVMTYAGVALAVVLSFGVLAWDTLRHLRTGELPAGTVRVLGLSGTRGFHLAAWGIALTVLAAPIDDLWHRLFGIDVTIWSPPHLLGLLGTCINSAACFLIAAETYRRGDWRRLATLTIAAATLYGGLGFALQPSFRMAYLYGGVWFYLYPILGALLLPLALVTPARVAGSRLAPLAVLLVVIALGLIGFRVAQAGFDILQPVSFIQEEIAKDPTSPIAVAHEIARKNGVVPGAPAARLQPFFLLPVVVMVLLDPRRRPRLATLAYGVGLLAVWGGTLARAPAFEAVVPSVGSTVVASALTLAAGAVGAAAAVWLGTVLSARAKAV